MQRTPLGRLIAQVARHRARRLIAPGRPRPRLANGESRIAIDLHVSEMADACGSDSDHRRAALRRRLRFLNVSPSALFASASTPAPAPKSVSVFVFVRSIRVSEVGPNNRERHKHGALFALKLHT